MNLKCLILGHDIAEKQNCPNQATNIMIGIIFSIVILIDFLILGVFILSFFVDDKGHIDGKYIAIFSITLSTCWFLAHYIISTKTYMLSSHIIDGICVRCEKMFFDASKELARVGRINKIKETKLQKFDRLSKLRSKSLGSSGGGS
jgi:hypothetical protein